MQLVTLSPGTRIVGIFGGWSDWYFNPENSLEVDWLPVLYPITKEGEAASDNAVALSNNAGLMARLRAAAFDGKLKDGDKITVDCTGETKLSNNRSMKEFVVKVNGKHIEDHQIVSVPPSLVLRDPKQLQVFSSDGKER